MTAKIITVTAERNYQVDVGIDWQEAVEEIISNHSTVIVIAPAAVANLISLDTFCSQFGALLFITPDGELQKDFSVVENIWNFLGTHQVDRTAGIIGIGGGATTDLAGFIAATWLRGIAWYAVPTTLAGMVDAAIGGKTGINTGAGKNLVGSFYSPHSVEIDLKFLDSLPDRDFSAGLAEVIKAGFIRDMTIIDSLENGADLVSARNISAELIAKSVKVKSDVVSVDFTESKMREILNFGHTFGHAVERYSDYSLRHGEAVSIGLHFAFLLSEQLLALDSNETARLIRLLHSFTLPTSILKKDYPWAQMLKLMTTDKKTRQGNLRFIGLDHDLKVVWLENVDIDVLHAVYERIAE